MKWGALLAANNMHLVVYHRDGAHLARPNAQVIRQNQRGGFVDKPVSFQVVVECLEIGTGNGSYFAGFWFASQL